MYIVYIDLKIIIKGSNVLHAVFVEHRLWVYCTENENYLLSRKKLILYLQQHQVACVFFSWQLSHYNIILLYKQYTMGIVRCIYI